MVTGDLSFDTSFLVTGKYRVKVVPCPPSRALRRVSEFRNSEAGGYEFYPLFRKEKRIARKTVD